MLVDDVFGDVGLLRGAVGAVRAAEGLLAGVAHDVVPEVSLGALELLVAGRARVEQLAGRGVLGQV